MNKLTPHREPSLPDFPGAAPPEPSALAERAIVAHNVTKIFHADRVYIKAVDSINFRVATGERLGILGGNGAGKSTLIKLVAGVMSPSSGYIHRGMTMSWPLSLGGGFFDGHLTGYDNVRFLSRLYERPFDETYRFVSDFSELTKKQMQTPVRFFSSGMMARLAFALSISIDFQCLLIDEVLVTGDRRFQTKCLYEVFDKRPDRAIVMAVHSIEIISTYCQRVLIMKNGKGRVFDDMEMAARIYATL